MKTLFLFALLAVSIQAGYGQNIAAGTTSLGGSIGYSRTTNKASYTGLTATTVESQFSFSPTVGYFVADNLEVGISGSYAMYRRPYTTLIPTPVPVSGTAQGEPDPATNLRIGVFGRYYKMFVEQFGVTGMLSGGYQASRDHVLSNNNPNSPIIDYKGAGYYAGLTPGLIFFPVPKLGISASIGSLAYSYMSNEAPTSSNSTVPIGQQSTSSTFGARFGLDQLQLGGTYYVGR